MLSYEWNEELYREVLMEEGEKKGRVEGRMEGRNEGLIGVARNMKAEGAEAAFIVRVTGLSEDDVAGL